MAKKRTEQEVQALLRSTFETTDQDAFHTFQRHTQAVKSVAELEHFIDANDISIAQLETWVETYLPRLPYSGNKHWIKPYGCQTLEILLKRGVLLERWLEDFVGFGGIGDYCGWDERVKLLILAISNGGDLRGYEPKLLKWASPALMEALQKRGYDGFSIYDAQTVDYLKFIEENAGGIAPQLENGSEKLFKLLTYDKRMTKYLLGLDIDLRLGGDNKAVVHAFKPGWIHDDTLKLLKLLVKNGMDINYPDEQGNTLLYRFGVESLRDDGTLGWSLRDDSLKALLELGADPTIFNHAGESFLSLIKNDLDAIKTVMSMFPAMTVDAANDIIQNTLFGAPVIHLKSAAEHWIDPTRLTSEAPLKLEPFVIASVFPTMLLEESRAFALHNEQCRVKVFDRLLVEYLMASMAENDVIRHINHFAERFGSAQGADRLKIALFFRAAFRSGKCAKHLEELSIDLQEIEAIVKDGFMHADLPMIKSQQVVFVSAENLDEWHIEEVNPVLFENGIKPHPFLPIFEKTGDGYFLAEAFGDLNYANHFVFTNAKSLRLRLEESIILSSSNGGAGRYPMETFREDIEPYPYRGVHEYCGDGYDGSGWREILCKEPGTLKLYYAYENYDRDEYYACKAIEHGKDYDRAGWMSSADEYYGLIEKFKNR